MGHHLLIVDDNKFAADALARLLEHDGYEVEVAYNGETALSRMRISDPAAIVLDLALPDKDGYAVAHAMKYELHSDALIIALTGYGQEEDKLRSRAAGFDHHLVKPVLAADVEKLVVAHRAKAR